MPANNRAKLEIAAPAAGQRPACTVGIRCRTMIEWLSKIRRFSRPKDDIFSPILAAGT
jgi:hypothetical protein